MFRRSNLDECNPILTVGRGNHRSVLRLADERQREKVCMFRSYDPEGRAGAELPDPYCGAGGGCISRIGWIRLLSGKEYHLLKHLNIFGSGYAGSVRRICRRYV